MCLENLEEDMMKEGYSGERLGMIQDMKQSCDIALCTLNDMLTADKIQSGFLSLEKKPVNLLECLNTSLAPYYSQVSSFLKLQYLAIVYTVLSV